MEFTHPWFKQSEIYRQRETILAKLLPPAAAHQVLEIGCYEGMSTVYWAEALLQHPESQLVCVDPFLPTATVNLDTRRRFLKNISLAPHSDRIHFHHMTSGEYFSGVPPTPTFDFIYIDGSHDPLDVEHDMEQCWARLLPGGVMWMDDYLGAGGKLKPVMDRWCRQHAGSFTPVWSGYQLAVQKNAV